MKRPALVAALPLVLVALAPASLAESFVCEGWTSPTFHGGLAHANGAAGSVWTTDLVAVNAGVESGLVRLTFLPGGGRYVRLLEAGAVLVVPDVVGLAGLPDGAYAATLETCGGTDAIRVTLTTRTPFAGGFLAVQLPALEARDLAVLPLVGATPSRAALYVVTEYDSRWRVEWCDETGVLGSLDGTGALAFYRLEPIAGATFARVYRFRAGGGPGGPGGWLPEDRVFAYVTIADSVTSSPGVVE